MAPVIGGVNPAVMTSDADLPADVERLLAASVAGSGGSIERIQTHGAVVFVGPRETLKVKRPVRYSYMDFSSLEQRRLACSREIEVNRPHAPGIYLGLVAVTRACDGSLALDGQGQPVEWAVRMRSFAQDMVLANLIERTALAPQLVKALADMAADYHCTAPAVVGHDTAAQIGRVATDIDATLRSHPAVFAAAAANAWREAAGAALAAGGGLLARRSGGGHVRRVHGDLHLGNIVLWDGRPVAFDAIEFDESLATIDTLYDLAFLLMDLERHGHRDHANGVLNRYLWRRQEPADLEALALLPLFLSVRAGVRAMVGAQRGDLDAAPERSRDHAKAAQYLDQAGEYLRPARPVLVAVGGLSGSGKSTLSAALGPSIGAAPGAVHLRSDLERKALFAAGETERLAPDAYTPRVTAEVYRRLAAKAQGVLRAGHSVVLDAVHGSADERQAAARIAADVGVPFAGLWLEAAPATLLARVEARRDDASDATASVVRQQLSREPGQIGWARIDASGAVQDTLASALRVLGVRDMLNKVVEKP